LVDSSNNIITRNNCSSSGEWAEGIILSNSNNNDITNNNASNNLFSIDLTESDSNDIVNNTANNGWCGIILSASDNNNIINNTISNNTGFEFEGIPASGIIALGGEPYTLEYSEENTIINNTISDNDCGIYLNDFTSENLLYHNNLICNDHNALDYSGNNYWNNSYPTGGNYWSDYRGKDRYSGPEQDEEGGDGVGDIPYEISGGAGAKDNYPLLIAISGIIYKDENNDQTFDSDIDIPLKGVNVTATLNGDLIGWNITDENGSYSINAPEGSGYTLDVTLKVCDQESINGSIENVDCPSENVNINVTYNMVNCGPDFDDDHWELWHAGPVFEDKPNVVLVHGIQIFMLSISHRGSCDYQFGNLDTFLQEKKHGQYNVWQFEYAEKPRLGGDLTDDFIEIYSLRFGRAIDKIKYLTGASKVDIISHSMGGWVSREYIEHQNGHNNVNKLLTLATHHFGCWYAGIAKTSECGMEIQPSSSFAWNLNKDWEKGLVEFAAIGGTSNFHNDGVVDVSSASLVECNEDGTVKEREYFTTVVRKHGEINDIENENDLVFLLILNFLKGGVSGISIVKAPEDPSDWDGEPFFTFCFKERAKCMTTLSGFYPRVEINGESHHWFGISWLGIFPHLFKAGGTGDTTPEGYEIWTLHTFEPWDDTTAQIYFHPDAEPVTIPLTAGQSTVRTEPIDNTGYGSTETPYVSLSITPIYAEYGGSALAGGSGIYTKHSISILPNALSEDTAIIISEPDDNHGLSSAVDFGPDELNFIENVTITVEYKDSDIPAGHTEDEMALLVWENDRWNTIAGSIADVEENTVSGQVDHLSIYAAGINPIPQTSLPDLKITDIWVVWPDNCTICYNVTNVGNGTALAGHNTSLFVDGVEKAYDCVTEGLSPNESYIGCFLDYDWIYTPPEDNITVCADINNTVSESNESNNCQPNTWKCGDVDRDGAVDFLGDVRGVARYYMYGDPIKCPWAGDVDCSGDIDFLGDVRGIARHYMYGEPLKCCCKEE
jgi:parallel beta-helix repeat protein